MLGQVVNIDLVVDSVDVSVGFFVGDFDVVVLVWGQWLFGYLYYVDVGVLYCWQ